MTTHLDEQWFSEFYTPAGLAFSLRIKRCCVDEQTPFQHIQIFETTDFGYVLVLDGFIQITTRDNFFYHEMMTHPALFTHPHPQHIAIIGGGDCGSLSEVLKHTSVTHVDQVELDEQVTTWAQRYFPELCQYNTDPRAHFHFTNGVTWLQTVDTASLDIIIIDCSEPIGPSADLFTQAFYQDCLRALKPGGIIVQQSESPLLHPTLIQSLTTWMQQAGFTATQTLSFPVPSYPSGWWSATLGRKAGDFTLNRTTDISQKSFPTQYYNLAIHHGASALPEFMNALKKQ